MEKLCKKACMDAAPFYKSKYIDDDDTYFGLRAKRWDGTTLNFGRFDGYVSDNTNELAFLTQCPTNSSC